MNENPGYEGEPARSPGKESFGVMLAMTFLGNGLAMATIVGLAGLILDLPARRLAVPYLVLLPSGAVLAPYLHFARLKRHRPRACALEFTIGFFSYLLALSAGLLFGAIWVDVLPLGEVLYDIVPPLLPTYVLLSVGIYFLTLQNLKDTQQS